MTLTVASGFLFSDQASFMPMGSGKQVMLVTNQTLASLFGKNDWRVLSERVLSLLIWTICALYLPGSFPPV
ncbi:MAG: hypothetical protein ACFC1C_00160 [Candidatus Malihini olakiniferum]